LVVDEPRLTTRPGRLSGRRVAVTGGGGFIGSHVVKALCDGAAEVKVVSAASTTLTEELACVDAVVHLDYRPPSGRDPLMEEIANNLPPLLTVMGAARRAGVAQICFASSTSVYEAGLGLREDAPPAARLTAYSAIKLQQEALLAGWARRAGRRLTILRLSTVYGPGEKTRRAIPAFIQSALHGKAPVVSGRGLGPFDPVFVEDVAQAFLAALACEAEGIFNIGTGVARAPLDVADLVVRLTRARRGPICDVSEPDRARPVCDCRLAEARLGFRARTPIEAGLQSQIDWLRGLRP
jgi:UDP-glucose 4-epimerase